MSILDCLPEVLFDIILTKWNGTRELGRLDSSYCNKQNRSNLLNAFKRDTFSIDMSSIYKPSVLSWLFTKYIRPHGSLSFGHGSLWSDEILPEKVMKENSMLFSKVQSVRLCLGYRPCHSEVLEDEHLYILKLNQFLNICPVLQRLQAFFIHSFCYNDLFLVMDQNILRNMTGFHLKGIVECSMVSMVVVNHISKTCQRLVFLHLCFSDWNENDIRELLLKHSKSLTNITFERCHLTDNFLKMLKDISSPYVTSLSLVACGGHDSVVKFTCELLKYLKVFKDLHVSRTVATAHYDMVKESVRVRNFGEESSLHMYKLSEETRHEILVNCPNNRKISLRDLKFTNDRLFMDHLINCNLRLHTISLSQCVFGLESYTMLRLLFQKCTHLAVIKIEYGSFVMPDHTLVSLLSFLPRHVTTLLLGHKLGIGLEALLSIVRSNPHLETLWYFHCVMETDEFDLHADQCEQLATFKKKIQECGGDKLNILDGEVPDLLFEKFFRDEGRS